MSGVLFNICCSQQYMYIVHMMMVLWCFWLGTLAGCMLEYDCSIGIYVPLLYNNKCTMFCMFNNRRQKPADSLLKNFVTQCFFI